MLKILYCQLKFNFPILFISQISDSVLSSQVFTKLFFTNLVALVPNIDPRPSQITGWLFKENTT